MSTLCNAIAHMCITLSEIVIGMRLSCGMGCLLSCLVNTDWSDWSVHGQDPLDTQGQHDASQVPVPHC